MSNNVTKLRASDGTVAWDLPGGHISGGHRLRRGQHLGDEPEQRQRHQAAGQRRRTPGDLRDGTYPDSIAFDGANIWVGNALSNNVTKLRASDGEVLGTYATGKNPNGIAFDGVNLWVTNGGDNTVSKH